MTVDSLSRLRNLSRTLGSERENGSEVTFNLAISCEETEEDISSEKKVKEINDVVEMQ